MKIPIRFKGWMMLALWIVIGLLYFPIYFGAWLLHIIARVLLAIAYFFMLQKQAAINTFSSVFTTNLKYF